MTRTQQRQRASDPNISPEELAQLLPRFPDESLANPALPLIVLENFAFLHELERGKVIKLLLRSDLPLYLVQTIALHPDKKVVEVAQMHVVFGEAQEGWQYEAAQKIAKLTHKIADRQAFYDRGLFPEWLLKVLPATNRPKHKTLGKMGTEKTLSKEKKVALQNLAHGEKLELAYQTDNIAVIRFLDAENSFALDYALTHNQYTPQDILAGYAKEYFDVPQFRDWLFSINTVQMIPTDILRQVWKEANASYTPKKNQVNKTPQCWFLEGYSANYSSGNGIQTWFLCLLYLEDIVKIQKSLKYPTWYSRFAIALNTNTPLSCLETLSQDANRFVRAAAWARLQDPNWCFEVVCPQK
jgi:hypothetical protein